MKYQRLGVNIDHVATLRNARGGVHPDPVHAARTAEKAGADGITAHLREDRRHIKDEDIFALKNGINIPLNFEMAATDEMVKIAIEVQPNACCLVPEKREELTTEGGLDVSSQIDRLSEVTAKLQAANIKVSLFIDADEQQIAAAKAVGADIVELHTGAYADLSGRESLEELMKIRRGAEQVEKLGIECHAGHGLNYKTVGAISAIPEIVELNIGHFIVGQAIVEGLDSVIHSFRRLMDNERQ